jgi:hypothetical protein
MLHDRFLANPFRRLLTDALRVSQHHGEADRFLWDFPLLPSMSLLQSMCVGWGTEMPVLQAWGTVEGALAMALCLEVATWWDSTVRKGLWVR